MFMIGRSLELIGCPYQRRQPRHEQFWPAQMPLHFMPMNMYVMASNCQEILYVDSLSISSASQYTPSDCIRRAKVVSPCQGFCIKVKGFKSGITRQLKFFHAFKCTDYSFSFSQIAAKPSALHLEKPSPSGKGMQLVLDPLELR
jgi:hypothetical protein